VVTVIEEQWRVTPIGVGRPDHTVRSVQEISIVTLWNNNATGAGGTAEGVIEGLDPCTLFFSTSGATNLTIEASPDGATYFIVGTIPYTGAATDTITLGDISYSIRLTSSADVTATAILYGHKVV